MKKIIILATATLFVNSLVFSMEPLPEKAHMQSTGLETQSKLSVNQQWHRNNANPIIAGNGSSILQQSDPCVIYDNQKYRMWFSSVGSNAEYALVGYAESNDGDTWSVPKIVFQPNTRGSWDDQTTEIPSIIKDADTDPHKLYKMWYGGSNKKHPNLTKIGYAYSPDGISWTRLPAEESPYGQEGLVMIPDNKKPGDYAVVAEPSVVKKDGIFNMWYSSWDGDALVISYATSSDGIHWNKSSRNPVLRHTKKSWEAGGLGLEGTVAQPAVIWDNKESLFKMWYGSFDKTNKQTYTGIGYAVSKDGISWTKEHHPAFTPLHRRKGEKIGISTGPCVLLNDDIFYLWYAGVDAHYKRVINYATMHRKK